MASAIVDASPQPKLLVPRAEAEARLHAVLQAGMEIKSRKIRRPEKLSAAREAKLQWTAQLTNLLNTLFSDGSVADECNGWIGPLLDEHNDGFWKFAEAFDAEMNYRLEKLQMVIKRIATSPAAEKPRAASGIEIMASDVVGPTVDTLGIPTGQMTLVASNTVPPGDELAIPTGIDLLASATASRVAHHPHAGHSAHPVHHPAPGRPAVPPTVGGGSDAPAVVTASMAKPAPRSWSRAKSVGSLIVHQASEQTRNSVAAFLEKLGFSVQLLEAQAGPGKTTLEQLAGCAELGLAVIMAGAEEIAYAQAADAEKVPRSSMAMAYELGCCAGRVGPQRVVVLYVGEGEMFCDEMGIAYVPVDPADGWQLRLARQIKRGGFDVDLNRLC